MRTARPLTVGGGGVLSTWSRERGVLWPCPGGDCCPPGPGGRLVLWPCPGGCCPPGPGGWGGVCCNHVLGRGGVVTMSRGGRWVLSTWSWGGGGCCPPGSGGVLCPCPGGKGVLWPCLGGGGSCPSGPGGRGVLWPCPGGRGVLSTWSWRGGGGVVHLVWGEGGVVQRPLVLQHLPPPVQWQNDKHLWKHNLRSLRYAGSNKKQVRKLKTFSSNTGVSMRTELSQRWRWRLV